MFADRIALSDDFSYKLGFFIIPTHEHKLASIYLKAWVIDMNILNTNRPAYTYKHEHL